MLADMRFSGGTVKHIWEYHYFYQFPRYTLLSHVCSNGLIQQGAVLVDYSNNHSVPRFDVGVG